MVCRRTFFTPCNRSRPPDASKARFRHCLGLSCSHPGLVTAAFFAWATAVWQIKATKKSQALFSLPLATLRKLNFVLLTCVKWTCSILLCLCVRCPNIAREGQQNGISMFISFVGNYSGNVFRRTPWSMVNKDIGCKDPNLNATESKHENCDSTTERRVMVCTSQGTESRTLN